MNLKDEIVKIFDEIKSKVSGAVSAEVVTDVHNIVEQGKTQAQQLLSEAGADIQKDAADATADASKTAADTSAALGMPQQTNPPAAPAQ